VIRSLEIPTSKSMREILLSY